MAGSVARDGDVMALTPDDVINFVKLYLDTDGKDKECAAYRGCTDCYYRSACVEDEIDGFVRELEPFAGSVKELRRIMEEQAIEIGRCKLSECNKGSTDKEDTAVLKGELEHCRTEISRLKKAIQALVWETPQSP